MSTEAVAQRRVVGRGDKKRGSFQSATILEIELRTPRIASVFLAPSAPFAFLPGQHLSVRVMASGSMAERKYSITSAPEAGAVIELAIEALSGGSVSGYFHRVAKAGDVIEIRGPKGGFTWSVEDGGPVLLIGGGSGLAPLMSMIRHRALRRSNVPMALVYSATSWEDVLFRDELIALAAVKDGFDLTLTLTRQARAEAGVHGRRIDREMLAEAVARLPSPPSAVFICGSDPFVDHVQAIVAQLGVPSGRVEIESYGI